MELRWKLNWKQLDAAQLEAAANAIRKLHPALNVSHEIWTPLESDTEVASIDVVVPKAKADHILRTLEPDASYPATHPDRGTQEGEAYRVSLGLRPGREQPGDYHLELSDEDEDNDPCWAVACALAERVAPILGGTFLDDGEDAHSL